MIDSPRRVFVDTAGWLALINTSDSLHSSAVQVLVHLSESRSELITTEFVLLEVADALSSPSFRSRTTRFVQGLRQWDGLGIVPASHDLLADGWELYSQRHDKDWGLTDCTSFVVMSREQITVAFTSDRHFQQAGFVKLL